MNKINNMLSTMFLLVLPLAFSACGDDVEYSPADKPGNEQVYFPTTMPKQVNLKRDATSFEVELTRVNTQEALTVNLETEDKSGLFTVPASVGFEVGKDCLLYTSPSPRD